MKIAAVCCTYLRPKQLGRLIKCFLEQDYPAGQRELIVLDDAGQYEPQQGDGWRLISVDRRFRSLGEKRNAAIGLTSSDVDALAVWDDDDLYLPWALAASAAALEAADWSRPGLVLHEQPDGTLWQHRTGGLFHGGWAYTRAAFERAGGYPTINNGEDQAFAQRLHRTNATESDPCQLGFQPFYIYSWGGGAGYHLSGLGRTGYEKLARRLTQSVRTLDINWPRDYRNATILPEIHPRVF